MSESRVSDAAPSAANASASASSHVRYRPASARSASSDLAESGSSRVSRAEKASSDGGRLATGSGRAAATRCAAPAWEFPPSTPAEAPFADPYPSSTTCAFTPEIPNALTPARGGRLDSSGHSAVSVITRTGSVSHSTSVLGLSK